ncbi:hypothetical protein ACFLZI_00850 [Nitrospirota bacterium]
MIEKLRAKSMAELEGMELKLQEKLKEFRARGDEKNEAEALRRIDMLKQVIGEKTSAGETVPTGEQHEDFDQWATETSLRYVDPSVYGDGPEFIAPPPEPMAAPAEPEPVTEPRLAEGMDNIKKYLVNEILKSVYMTVTQKGKKSLHLAISETRSNATSISPIKRFENNIRNGFKKVFEKLKTEPEVQQEILFHLVLELDEEFRDISANDDGAVRIIKNLIAHRFLDEGFLKRPGIQDIL